MLLTKLRIGSALILMVALLGVGRWGMFSTAATATPPETPQAKQPAPPLNKDGTEAGELLAARFEETLKLIRPQPGESRWMQIPWQTSLWKARQMAAAAGKPMFVWSGSGGAPCAPT